MAQFFVELPPKKSLLIHLQMLCMIPVDGDLWAEPQLYSMKQEWEEKKGSLICMHRQLFHFHNQTHEDLTIRCLLYLSSLVKDSVENSQQSAHIVHFPVLQ